MTDLRVFCLQQGPKPMSKKDCKAREEKNPYFSRKVDFRSLVFNTMKGFLFAKFVQVPLESIVNI